MHNTVRCLVCERQQQQQLYQKAKKYIKHTHCLHLAKAIRGKQRGYSETVMQTLDFVSGFHNGREFSQRLECLYQATQTKVKSFL